MKLFIRPFALFTLLLLPFAATWADSKNETADAIAVFKGAGESGKFFNKAYGYAVFPSIGKGGIGIGAAHGDGKVFVGGKEVGKSSMTQVSVGLQLGGQVFSQIIFFEDKRAFDEFTSGNFEFGAEASAVAITAAASASTSTEGNTASASGGKNNADTAGAYHKGYAVFTVAKGGLMYAATLGGQKYSYKPL
jgi:lipid-binding SYLF domain-containing protein